VKREKGKKKKENVEDVAGKFWKKKKEEGYLLPRYVVRGGQKQSGFQEKIFPEKQSGHS